MSPVKISISGIRVAFVSLSRVIVAGILGFVFVPLAGGAVTTTSTIIASVASIISVSSNGTLTLSVTPATGGSQTTDDDTVSVTTNSSSGYTLTLADTDATTTLVNGGDSISAHSGTQASPSALANNSWGYRVDTIGGFGAGPGAASTNQTTNTLTFAGVPATGAANTIRTTATTASSETTSVWYSVKVDGTKPSGSYSDSVTYTATTNP